MYSMQGCQAALVVHSKVHSTRLNREPNQTRQLMIPNCVCRMELNGHKHAETLVGTEGLFCFLVTR